MDKTLLIKNGHMIDPDQNIDAAKDILVSNGKIEAVEDPGKIYVPEGTPTIDAAGKIVTPGFIDLHVHFREPGGEHKETIESGIRSAEAGGFTSVACMANTTPVNDNAFITTFIMERARAQNSVKVYPIGAISKGLHGEQLAEIGKMVKAGVVAISDDGRCLMNAYLMRKAMDYSKAFDIPVMVHAEDEDLVGKGVINQGVQSTRLGLRGIPAEAEDIIVARDIRLAEATGAKLHVSHLSTRNAAELVLQAKDKGLPISAEVTPHHLHLTENDIGEYNTNCKMRPPLRTESDKEAMRKYLGDGTIDCIATDHAPHSPEEKEIVFEEAANGIIGLETALPLGLELVRTGQINMTQLVQRLSSSPARIIDIEGGSLARGKTADITIFDPEEEYTYSREDIHSKSRNTPFLGWNFKGRVKHTLIAGRSVFEG